MKRNPYLWQCAGALFLIVLTSACGGPITKVTPGPGTPQPIPSNQGPGGAQPTTGAVPGSQATMAANAPSGGGPASLTVTTPQDGAIVNTSQIQVSGTASPGAVVSVNDTVLVAGADGSFSTSLSLDPGPNLVEVIASTTSGDSKTLDLTVTYQQ